MLLWSALILFILWILGVIVNVGVGVHMFLLIAIGCFIVGLMGRAGSSLERESERKSVETGRRSAGARFGFRAGAERVIHVGEQPKMRKEG
jgi:uncharacterized membrane protein